MKELFIQVCMHFAHSVNVLKETPDTSIRWPQNRQRFLFAGFIWWFCQHLRNRSRGGGGGGGELHVMVLLTFMQQLLWGGRQHKYFGGGGVGGCLWWLYQHVYNRSEGGCRGLECEFLSAQRCHFALYHRRAEVDECSNNVRLCWPYWWCQ